MDLADTAGSEYRHAKFLFGHVRELPASANLSCSCFNVSTSCMVGMASEQLSRLTTIAAAAFPYLRHSITGFPRSTPVRKPDAKPSPAPIVETTGTR